MVCDIALLQDKLTGALVGLARATENNDHLLTDSTAAVVIDGLCATRIGAAADSDTLLRLIGRVDEEKRKLVPDCYTCTAQCGRTGEYDMEKFRNAGEDVRSLKFLILSGIRDIALCVRRAAGAGWGDRAVHRVLYKALFAVGMDDWGEKELLPILLEIGKIGSKSVRAG